MSSRLIVNSIRHTGASGDAVTLANDGTCTANITNRSNRNLIINGAMMVAQRGTSAASDGYGSLDRFSANNANNDEMPTQSQEDVASGTSPYAEGFRKCFRMTNGNQTGGAGAADRVCILYDIEAQDLANSGWDYTSSSSFITIQFWVKASVAQNYYVLLRSRDGTERGYVFETGALSADTWTKVTKTIPGNTSPTIQIDNNTGSGMHIEWNIFRGTDKTGSVTLNQWATFDGSARVPDMTSTWYTTNDATFEITGVQLEVGSVATDFEHRSFGQELALCQRYYEENQCTWAGYTAAAQGNGSLNVIYMTQKRAAATLTKKVSESSVQSLTSVNLQDAHVSGFVIDTRINSSGYGRFYDLIAASDAEL